MILLCDWLQGTSGPDPTTVYVDMRALRHDRYDHLPVGLLTVLPSSLLINVCLCQGPVSGERLSSQSASHGVWKGERLFIHLALWLKGSCASFHGSFVTLHLNQTRTPELIYTTCFTRSWFFGNTSCDLKHLPSPGCQDET